jgi:hypothetical protein
MKGGVTLADTSDLHPAVVHALRTGSVEPAIAAAKLNAPSTAKSGRTSRTESPRRTDDQQRPPPTVFEEDDFYQGFRSNPLGRR